MIVVIFINMKKILSIAIVGLLIYTSAGIAGVNEKNNVKKETGKVITIPEKIEKQVAIQPAVKIFEGKNNEKKEESLPTPWGWVWMGILDGDWGPLVSSNNENGTNESGIGVEITYKIVAIGYHHIEVKGEYFLFGDVEDYHGDFSFPEDSFIFIMKKKTIPLSFPGAEKAYVDAYLYIDGRRWGHISILAPQ